MREVSCTSSPARAPRISASGASECASSQVRAKSRCKRCTSGLSIDDATDARLGERSFVVLYTRVPRSRGSESSNGSGDVAMSGVPSALALLEISNAMERMLRGISS
jgi:hypothetical protein